MVAPIKAKTVSTFGREKWGFAPAVANIEIPKLSEVMAAAGLDLSCVMFTSTARPSQETNTVSRARLMCERNTYQSIGATNKTGGELHYSIDPQAPADDDQKKAWVVLGGQRGGVSGFLFQRFGPLADVDWAADQWVSPFPVDLGPGLIVPEGDDEEGLVSVVQTYVITGPSLPLVKIAAAA